MQAGALPNADPGRRGDLVARLAPAGVVLAALVAAYAPNFYDLSVQWEEPNYSHGYLVVPIALAILWQRRGELDPARFRPAWWGWLLALQVLVARAWFYERNEIWLENVTLLPMLAALALAFGGWHLLRWALPGIVFLAFMFPLPASINLILAGPLQRLATIGSTTLLQAFGLPVLAEGNVIFIGPSRLEVATACNGLSMLLSFVTLVAATVLLMARSRPLWERIVLMASTIPIALISNIIRIAVTAWAYQLLGEERGEKMAHDTAGWAMMPIALALVWIEIKLMSWLIIEEEQTERLVVPTTFSAPTRAPKKPK